jgi:predicted 3-demethylubiquinone-9 3-methyltransferase (glyoxalase superfamily)
MHQIPPSSASSSAASELGELPVGGAGSKGRCKCLSPADGRYEWCKVRGRAMRDERGTIVRWFGTAGHAVGGTLPTLVIVQSRRMRMKAKQLAVNTFAALAVAALMATALAHAGEHEGERPDASTGLVRDVREVTQNFHDVTAAMAAGYVSAGSCESGPNEGASGRGSGVLYLDLSQCKNWQDCPLWRRRARGSRPGAGHSDDCRVRVERAAFHWLNGGPVFKFNEAISLQVICETQEEIDYYWERLATGGDENAQQCGWLKDKYGVSWQIIPAALVEMSSDPDPARSGRVMEAILKMKKINLDELKRAYAG